MVDSVVLLRSPAPNEPDLILARKFAARVAHDASWSVIAFTAEGGEAGIMIRFGSVIYRVFRNPVMGAWMVTSDADPQGEWPEFLVCCKASSFEAIDALERLFAMLLP